MRTLVEEAPGGDRPRCGSSGRGSTSTPDGRPALTREGGHSRDRIVHAGGDASGAEVTRTLAGALRARGIEVLEHTVALDALRTVDGRVVGLRVARIGDDGALVDAGDLRARAVVLATGGYGQRLRRHVQPRPAPPATGWRWPCGPAPRSPTSRWCSSTRPCCGPVRAPRASRRWSPRRCAARAPSSSTATGRRIMAGAHPLADLAPRDVVSATIAAHLRRTGEHHVFLDATAARRRVPRPPLPRHPARLPRGRLRPGHASRCRSPRPRTTRAAACSPTSTAAPSVAGPVRGRRGRVHRRPRREPARVELDHRGARRGPALRRPAGRRPARAAASRWRRVRRPRRDRPGRPAVDHRGRDPRRRRASATPRASPGWPTRSPPSPAARRPPAGPRRARGDRAAHRGHACCAPRRSPAPRAAAATAAPTPRTPAPSGRCGWCTGSTTPAACTRAPSRSGRSAGRGMTRLELGAIRRAHVDALSAAGLDPAEVEAVDPARAGGGPRLRSRRDHGVHRAGPGAGHGRRRAPRRPACWPVSRSPRRSSTSWAVRRSTSCCPRPTATPPGPARPCSASPARRGRCSPPSGRRST